MYAEHEQKICSKCKETKKFSEFYKRNGKPKSECKKCHYEWCKKYSKTENGFLAAKKAKLKLLSVPSKKERFKKQQKFWTIAKKYNISEKEYFEMLNNQNNKCSICKEEISDKTAVVDHNHASGKVRDLLCRNCNTGLGMFFENIFNFKNAVTYLEKFMK
jgi:hypothetical protein